MATSEDDKELLIHLLIKMGLIDKGFYGKLTLDFQNGKIIHYIKEESGKL